MTLCEHTIYTVTGLLYAEFFLTYYGVRTVLKYICHSVLLDAQGRSQDFEFREEFISKKRTTALHRGMFLLFLGERRCCCYCKGNTTGHTLKRR